MSDKPPMPGRQRLSGSQWAQLRTEYEAAIDAHRAVVDKIMLLLESGVVPTTGDIDREKAAQGVLIAARWAFWGVWMEELENARIAEAAPPEKKDPPKQV